MELREITTIDELSELVSSCTFDEFYQKIVEENRKYEEEYYEAHKSLFFQRVGELRGLKRIAYGNWAVFGKIMRLQHLARGIKKPRKYYAPNGPVLVGCENNKYQYITDDNSDTRPFFDIAKDIYDNIGPYRSTYEWFEDEASKNVLMGLLAARLTGDCRHLTDLASKNPQYFDRDIVKAYADEVVADAGGYIGDTALALLQTPEAKGNIRKIYLYEPNQNNMEKARKNLSGSEAEIVFRKAGVSDKRGSLFIAGSAASGRLTADGQGTNRVDIVALDEDIEEKVTFIKMDIEGSEKAALRGCERHIREDAPTLAICVYHKLDDVWQVPQYIKSLNPNYKFYLRHYGPLNISETVMYCLPR